MQIVINAKGFELFFRASKKRPIPGVIIAKKATIPVEEVAEMFRYYWPEVPK